MIDPQPKHRVAGEAAARALSHRMGLTVAPDTMLDLRETPAGLVHFTLDLLGACETEQRLTVSVRPASDDYLRRLLLYGVDDPQLTWITREVPTYRFHAIEELLEADPPPPAAQGGDG